MAPAHTVFNECLAIFGPHGIKIRMEGMRSGELGHDILQRIASNFVVFVCIWTIRSERGRRASLVFQTCKLAFSVTATRMTLLKIATSQNLSLSLSLSHTHTHTHTHAHTHARTHTHTHTRARTHGRTHTHTHARTHARTHTHACTHARTHTHTHTE